MDTFDQIKSGVSKFLENLSEGWNHLRETTGNAITRFTPGPDADEITADEHVLHKVSRWSILAAEVIEKEDIVVVKMEIPGMQSEDFDIQIKNKTLIISGEKKTERMTEKGHFHIMERAYGHFERTVPLPANVREDKASASYKRGILHVWLPKCSSEPVKRSIKVDAG